MGNYSLLFTKTKQKPFITKLIWEEIRQEGFLHKAIYSKKVAVEVIERKFLNTTVSEAELPIWCCI